MSCLRTAETVEGVQLHILSIVLSVRLSAGSRDAELHSGLREPESLELIHIHSRACRYHSRSRFLQRPCSDESQARVEKLTPHWFHVAFLLSSD